MTAATTFWGDHLLAQDTSLSWDLGRLHLSVLRSAREWQLNHCYRLEVSLNGLDLRYAEHATSKEVVQRHLFAATDGQLRLQPRLPDKSVVVRPWTPCVIHPGERITLYVGIPLWVAILLQQARQRVQELPLVPLTDTWFGPSTRNGELCYAVRTRARVNLAELEVNEERALSAVHIENRAATPLSFDRLSLPLPVVALYRQADGLYWTQDIHLRRDADDLMAEVQIRPGAPQGQEGAERLSEPRQPAGKRLLIRAFSALFGAGG